MNSVMIELDDGSKCWFVKYDLHREDGPAVERTDGTKEWWLNNSKHREDGPAVEWADGKKEWFLNGKRHREDGPAYEGSTGSKFWFLNDTPISEEEFNQFLEKKALNEKLQSTLPPRPHEKKNKI